MLTLILALIPPVLIMSTFIVLEGREHDTRSPELQTRKKQSLKPSMHRRAK